MTPWEWFGWIVFVIIISLLFFAAFGSTRYTHSNVEEYMETLIREESERSGSSWQMPTLQWINDTYAYHGCIRWVFQDSEDMAVSWVFRLMVGTHDTCLKIFQKNCTRKYCIRIIFWSSIAKIIEMLIYNPVYFLHCGTELPMVQRVG